MRLPNAEDPSERPDYITNIINGLERYNPEAVGTLESYLTLQCEEKFCDCNANRTLLKLYQLNPDRIKEEVVTNILVKAMTQFPSSQFSQAMHLISPSALAQPTELSEAVGKLRDLNLQLEGAQYARFWVTIESDDLYADLTTDIKGFEDMIRTRIAVLASQAFREIQLPLLEDWLGLSDAALRKFLAETCGWPVEGTTITVPKNPDNEAKKAEIREDVNVEMFSRVLRRAWEETA